MHDGQGEKIEQDGLCDRGPCRFAHFHRPLFFGGGDEAMRRQRSK